MGDGKNEPFQEIPLDRLVLEEGIDDLLNSPNMQPYTELAVAAQKGENLSANLEKIFRLPLEKRYTWRVASALKWAFADCDTFCVQADLKTLSEEETKRVLELVRLRPQQFCLFLAALLGKEEMRRIMTDAIRMAGA